MEVWRRIFDGNYAVSNEGRVKRLTPSKGATPGKILTPVKHFSGKVRKNYIYHKVALSVFGEVKKRYVHRLVAGAFLGPCPKGMQVNHKDGNTFNNRSENLEYVTNQENALHASAQGLLVCGEAHADAKLNDDKVRRIREEYSQGVSMAKLASKYGVVVGTIHPLIHRKTWKHVT